MNTALLVTYILTVLLLIATPGPVVALVVNTASQAGARRALATALGTNGASLVLIGVAAWVVASSAAIDARLLTGLSLLGCGFIAYVALSTLRDARRSKACAQAAPRAQRGGLWQGFMVGISNPKDILFFISFFPQFIQITASFKTSLMVLSSLWMLIDLLVLGTWILIAGGLARRIDSRVISLCSGSALLLIAGVGLLYNLGQFLS